MFRYPVILALALSGSLAAGTGANAATFAMTDEGLAIDAGRMGKFTLSYPVLTKAQQDQTDKPVEARPAGTRAALKYASGAQADLEILPDGTLEMKFAKVPGDVKHFRMEMLIDFNIINGGAWQAEGGQEKPFPAEKPATPHLFQGNVTWMTFKGFDGKTLTLSVPQYSYIQLTDCREWNWKTFSWFFIAPYQAGTDTYRVRITEAAGGAAGPVRLVDAIGQSARAEFPMKVKSVEELHADVAAEQAYYASLNPPQWDAYGGQPGSGAKLGMKKTGFFHVEKKGTRWILVDPAGNAFFHLGICGFQPSDDYTYIKGREDVYEWLPPYEGDMKSAYRAENGREVVSFHIANTVRKYGKPYELDSYLERVIPRVRKWGFNSVGAFSANGRKPHVDASFPYVSGLPLDEWSGRIPRIPGVRETFDPFDEKNIAQVEKNFAGSVAARANEPLLIGYFIVNEPLYEDLPRVVPGLDGKHACKRRLVAMLREKHRTIEAFNKAWGLQAKSFEELENAGLAVKTQAAADDVQAFTAFFMEAYFKLVAETFRKYDPNHMLLGCRLQSGTINNESLCRTMGKYCDIVSFNCYTYAIDKEFITRIYRWCGERPMMLSEFHYNSPAESGLPGGVKDVKTQQERGLAYRNYVEQAAALGYVIGVEWFTLIDQAQTGRWFSFYNGEAGNTGLLSVADRPWKPMLAEMMKTNYDIYRVLLGERKPFVFDDPRFQRSGTGRKVAKISRAAGEMRIDGTAGGWPGMPAEQIPGSRLVQGADAGGLEASFKLCWDDRNLYVLTSVVDSTPMKNAHTGNMLWSADGLEIFLGAEQIDQGGPLRFTDRQILLGAGRADGAGQFHFANAPAQHEVKMAVVPNVDGKGYTLEAAIPFEALGFTPKEGMEILFDMAVDDSPDGKARRCQLMWNGVERNSGDRSAWGRGVFVR